MIAAKVGLICANSTLAAAGTLLAARHAADGRPQLAAYWSLLALINIALAAWNGRMLHGHRQTAGDRHHPHQNAAQGLFRPRTRQ